MSEIILTIDGVDPLDLYGRNNSKLNLLKKAFPDLTITSRGQNLKLSGERKDTQKAKARIESMVNMLKQNIDLTEQSVMDLLEGHNPYEVAAEDLKKAGKVIVHGRNGRPIKAKTKNQRQMVEKSESNDVVFAIGPAGTGKTYTAVALAVRALKNKLVKKIILTRPAVEAGESLGFLPGDLKDKVDPYLRPLYDALDDMIPSDKLDYFMTNRVIEVAPLAFMRGRTLDNAFIILDEAQNCTTTQIKMFLTRLGPSAKCIVTGDLSQIDLPGHQKSGLFRALDILSDINGIGRVRLSADDVVRHRLVKDIILKYDESDRERRARFENKAEEE
ncbi:MAG: PhoH family protein [Saprospiraceae bacterium]|nr:PhoH family protein [Saprospiraceae bacterium]